MYCHGFTTDVLTPTHVRAPADERLSMGGPEAGAAGRTPVGSAHAGTAAAAAPVSSRNESEPA